MSTSTVPTLEALRARRDEIIQLAAKFGATEVRIFGSVARGESDEKSDVDVLVDMGPDPDGMEYFGRREDLRRALSELLGYSVDIVDSEALNPTNPSVSHNLRSFRRMRTRVMRDAVAL